MSFLKDTLVVLQLVMSLLPTIMNVVRQIEVPGYGSEKLGLITKTIAAGIELLPVDVKKQIGVDKVEAFAKKVVEYIVSFFNTVGVFGK